MNRWTLLIVVVCSVVAMAMLIGHTIHHRSAKRRRSIPTATRLQVLRDLLAFVSGVAAEDPPLHPFLLYGTLLGWVRSRNFICYDFDVDIGVYGEHEYETLLERLKRAMTGTAFTVTRYRVLPSLGGCDYFKVLHAATGLNLDVFVFVPTEGGMARCRFPAWYKVHYYGECADAVPVDWILPLSSDHLCDMPV